MCTEKNAEVCQELVEQCISAPKIRNMNNILRKLLSQLMGLAFPQPKTTTPIRSALNHIPRVNSRRTIDRFKSRKISKANSKRLKGYKPYCPRYSQKHQIFSTSAVSKSSTSSAIVGNATSETEPKSDKAKVPLVYLTDVLTTQGRTSKLDFMKYFGLQVMNGSPSPEPSKNISNIGFIKFSQAVNVPLSSDIGILMASRENHILSEDFKLRKIDRCEWYVNRPYAKVEDTCNYPIRCVNKNAKKSLSNEKYQTLNVQKMFLSKKFCRPVSVNLLKLDLLKVQKNLRRNNRHRLFYRKKKMSKNSERLKVLIKASEKKIVDELLKEKDLI